MTAISTIPCNHADLGHVLACIGLMECELAACASAKASEGQQLRATGCFIEKPEGGEFHLHSPAGHTLQDLVGDLMTASFVSLHPAGQPLAEKGVVTQAWSAEREFPALPPDKPSALPLCIDTGRWQVRISSWAEATRQTRRDSAKFWAGNYTGASVARAILEGTRTLSGNQKSEVMSDPLAYSDELSSSYRLDYTRDYIPIDSGFSPNSQKGVLMLGHPLVELLAAIGLEHARPERLSSKLAYRYGVPVEFVELPLVRATLSCAKTGVPSRTFAVELGWPGKEGQARCITRVVEEETR